MKCKKIVAVLLASVMSCLLYSSASAAGEQGNVDSVVSFNDNPHGGTLMKDAITGEVTYLPDNFGDEYLSECDEPDFYQEATTNNGISIQAIIDGDDRQKNLLSL